MKWNEWTTFWLCWILVGVVAEGIALYRGAKGDTLSEQVWGALDLPGYGKFLAWMLTAMLIWAAVHFVTRGRYG